MLLIYTPLAIKSGFGTAACVYAVVAQPSGVSQGLLSAKSRLAKKGLTIPRLELVSGHMAAYLLATIRNSLTGLPVRSFMDDWIVL